LDEPEVRVCRGALEKADAAGRKIVISDDAVAFRKETIGQVAPNEARCSVMK
jgi:hypothetical protein